MVVPQHLEEEAQAEVQEQNHFGLKVIGGALAFTALLLFILSVITPRGKMLTAGVGVLIMLSAIIPYRAAWKIKSFLGQVKNTKQEASIF